MKIIQILPHSLSPYNDKVDPRFYEEDWHVKVSKKVKKITNKYEIECWRPERNLKQKYTRTGADGITYKIFPSKYFKKFEYSPLMVKELKTMGKTEILLHFHGIFYPNTYYILKSLQKEVPVVAQSHASSPTLIRAMFDKTPLIALEHLEFLIQRICLKKVDQFFCLSKEEKEKFSEYADAIIQPMGIDFNNFKSIEKGIAQKEFKLEKKSYILYVGRIDEVKGIDYLIKGFNELLLNKEDIYLLIAGEGPYKNEIEYLINKLGISKHVKFLGFVENKRLPYLYNAADATLSPSLWEAYPVVPIESLACKTPLLTTNVGAIPEITGHFRGGFKIIPMKNADAIKNAIDDVISGKINENQIDRENGKKYHEWDNIIKNTISVYDKLNEEYYG